MELKKSNLLRFLFVLFLYVLPLALSRALEYPKAEQAAQYGQLYSNLSRNIIYRENQKPGTTRWQSVALNRIRNQQLSSLPRSSRLMSQMSRDTDKGGGMVAHDSWTDTEIRGYANETSINHGESIQLYVSTSQPSYHMEVYRMGWYGSTGGRLITSISDLPGQNQPVPAPQTGTGLIECHWQVSYTLKTASNWVSGVYLVKLIAKDNSVAYILFALRDDGAPASILYQVALTTYQAYNNWGGKSLYDFNSTGGRAYKVSYDRPYSGWDGAGFFFDGDYNMIRWLESHNYNVTYVTSVDTHTNPNMYRGRKIFLSNWHDEYWSKQMRDNLTVARNQGTNIAFFDANNIYWQIRFEASTIGIANRVQVCYKNASLDPLSSTQPELTTVNWRDAPVNKPENALLGIMYESDFNYGTSFPWVVTHSNHWIYQGTGLKDGDRIPGLVGYEYDKVWDNGLTPANLTVLSSSPVVDGTGRPSIANGALYMAPSNALVFSAGTIYWAWKLDDNPFQRHGADPNVQLMTANLLKTMISESS